MRPPLSRLSMDTGAPFLARPEAPRYSRPARFEQRSQCAYGIVIYMYYRDHGAPHFHAIYGGQEAVITIQGCVCSRGACPDVRSVS
jgi:hypothetical protein